MKRYIPTVLIHPELTRKELEEAAEKYHFSGTDAGMDAEGIREIYEKLCKAVDCRAACAGSFSEKGMRRWRNAFRSRLVCMRCATFFRDRTCRYLRWRRSSRFSRAGPL